MPCNCGSGANGQKSYEYTSPTGQTKTFNTEIEAKAAQLRAGGGGSIRAVSR